MLGARRLSPDEATYRLTAEMPVRVRHDSHLFMDFEQYLQHQRLAALIAVILAIGVMCIGRKKK